VRELVIEVRGGLVDAVYVDGDPTDVRLLIVDWDVDQRVFSDYAWSFDEMPEETAKLVRREVV
jgi:hypothetical protein